jgi:hypothetical protein
VLAGGFAGLIEDGRGFEIAPIEFEITDDLAHWRVDGKAGAAPRRSRAQPLPREARGSTTRRVRRSPRDVGTANEDEVEAFGLQWSPPARSSKHLPFDWSRPDEPRPEGQGGQRFLGQDRVLRARASSHNRKARKRVTGPFSGLRRIRHFAARLAHPLAGVRPGEWQWAPLC